MAVCHKTEQCNTEVETEKEELNWSSLFGDPCCPTKEQHIVSVLG